MTPIATTRQASAQMARNALTEALMCDVVERLAARPALWGPLVDRGAKDEPSWLRLLVREDLEVFVVTWPTASETTLHSHDGVDSAFRVVAGVLTEIRPENGRLMPRKYEPGLTGLIKADEIHDVQNERSPIAVSIHAYSGRLSSMTYYDWNRGAAIRRWSGPRLSGEPVAVIADR